MFIYIILFYFETIGHSDYYDFSKVESIGEILNISLIFPSGMYQVNTVDTDQGKLFAVHHNRTYA